VPTASPTRTQRLLWFAGLWIASVAATLLAAAALRWLFGRMLAS
jgi:hypothetical protein